jgi:geranylgeranyl pyrophosphate synthase
MFPEILTEARSLVLKRINSLINAESKVSDSMLYTSTAESKMIRSALLITASKKNTCLTKSSAINLATSIELLHSYSLIHDDLPSMDNDNMRRGKDSNHIKYGEAIAILSGDCIADIGF